MLWVLWMTYGSFYFCRSNISAALPGIQSELGFSKADLGWVLASLKIAYAIGQLINGQLAERISPRKLLAIGMFGSAALNVVFGFGTAIYFWLFVWACNGYAQSLGWTPTVRIAANWLSVEGRGVHIGILGTSYQVTAAVTFVVAGSAAEYWGWRAAMWVPAGLFALSGVHTLLLVREAPPNRPPVAPANPWTTLAKTLNNPGLWVLALALGLLNGTRYGFLDWGLSHVKEVQDTGVADAALKYAVLPIGGIGGSLVSGWVSDRFFGGRRAPVCCALLLVLSGLTLGYHRAAQHGVVAVLITLLCVGFTIYGAQVLLVGTLPIDLARPGTAAASVGLVNSVGYVGASMSDVVSGHVIEAHGWATAVRYWAAYALVAAALMGLLWRRRPSRVV